LAVYAQGKFIDEKEEKIFGFILKYRSLSLKERELEGEV
jgi:hypothetical protein